MENRTTIEIAYPDAAELRLRLTVGACRLKIVPGNQTGWISGTYDDPWHAVPLRVDQDGGNVHITQSFIWPESWHSGDRPPELTLSLGSGRPFALALEIGANEGVIDLGGLPVTRLTVKHGAGKQSIDFSAPNPVAMDLLSIAAGATELTVRHLANANFAELSVEGGAAAYLLDFGGEMRRDARARINTGMASVDLRLPAQAAARVTTETVMGSVEVGDGLTRRDGAFYNEAGLAGRSPQLSIEAHVAMGSIRLRLA